MSPAALNVRVSRLDATSAIARPVAPSKYAPQHPTTPKQLLDVLTAALWRFLGGIDAEFAGWTREQGISRESDLARVLDLLMQASGEDSFPYPGSPRLDGNGGGRRVAPDGSPGVPPAWLRYITRAHGVSKEESTRAHGPLLLALSSLANGHPKQWRVYALHVIDGIPLSRISMAYSTAKKPVAVSTVSRQVAQARTLLLGYLAFYDAAIDSQDFDYLMQLSGAARRKSGRQRARR